MVAVVSGNGLGLLNGSLGVLGGQGSVGSSSQGRLGESVFVNAATGNLVVSHLDDAIISGRGTNGLARTYNSLGMADGDNNDGWRIGVYRSLGSLIGTVNTANSTIQKTESDGSLTTFTYDTSLSLYVSKDGSGAYNTLSYNSGTLKWTYRDGDSQASETYDWISSAGKILSETDLDGNTTTYGYTGSLITSITTQNVKGSITETIALNYSGTLLSNITFNGSDDAGVAKSSRRVSYAYTSNRLTNVTVDLSPDDLSTADNKLYSTNYTYDANGRLWTMTQSDGTSLTFTYDANGRVATVTDALNRTTSYDYSVAGQLTITDALALKTVITFETAAGNSNGYIKTITYPGGGAPITYTYTANGEMASVQDNFVGLITYSYDANGNLLQQWDAAGNTVSYTYDSANRKLSETHYTGIDADGAGATYQASGAQTTRYVYDPGNLGHLRFTISPEGRVTERVYSNVTGRKGALTSSISYNAALYTTAGTPTEAQLATWVAGIDKSQGQRTDYVYDWRGQVSTSTQYVNLNADGTGNTSVAANVSTTTYVYDARGQLLKTIDANLNPTVYAYDGMGRVIGSTNALSQSSVTSYDDAGKKVTVDYANGRKVVSTFDAAGQLTSVMESNSGLSDLGTTRYYYDANGHERMRVDATGLRHFTIYSPTNLIWAEIDSLGNFTKYLSQARGVRYSTLKSANPISSSYFVPGGANSLLNADGTPSVAALDSNTLAIISRVADTEVLLDNEQDSRTYTFYDAAERIGKTVDEKGYATEYQYDGANRIIKTIRYLTPIVVSGITGTTKSTDAILAVPTDSADRTTRTFYDNDGLKRGDLDAEGYLTEYQYDNLGRLNHSIRYANATPVANRDSGTLASLIPAADATNDQHSYVYYDSEGRAIASVDAQGYLSTQSYDKAGNVLTSTRYKTAVSASTSSVVSTLVAAAGAGVTTTKTYDALNRLSTETSVDGTVTQYLYNSGGQLESKTVALGAVEPDSVARTTRYSYDLDGQLVTATQAEGGVTTNYYDAANRLIKTVSTNGLDANGIASKDNVTLYYYGTTYTYDAGGNTPRLYNYTVDALGYVTRTSTNPLGQVTETRKSAKAITDTAFLTSITNGSASGRVIASGDSIITTLNTAFDFSASSLDQRSTTTYTINGLVQAVQDALGNTTTYSSYNAFGQATQVDQALGDGTGRIVSSKYEYDHRGSTTKTYSDSTGFNLLTQASYDAFGRVISTTDAANNTRTTQYDRLGRTLQITDALNNSRSMTYDAFGRVLTQSDAYGNKTLTSYDDVNRTVTVTSPEGVITTTTKTRHGQTLSIKDGLNNTTSYSYDKNGNLKQITNPDNSTQKSDFDAGNRLIASYDGNNVKTIYSYDAINRQLSRTVDPTGLAVTTTTSYSSTDNTVTQTDANGVVTTTTFDAKGQAVLIKTGVNLSTGDYETATQITYDALGHKTQVIEGFKGTDYSEARTTVYTYDTLGRRITETIKAAKDVAGTGVVDLITRYSYDVLGNVITKTDANGNTTNFVYDAENRLTFTIDATGAVTEQKYDANGRVIDVIKYAQKINNDLSELPGGPNLIATGWSGLATPIDAQKAGFSATGPALSLVDRDIYAGVWIPVTEGEQFDLSAEMRLPPGNDSPSPYNGRIGFSTFIGNTAPSAVFGGVTDWSQVSWTILGSASPAVSTTQSIGGRYTVPAGVKFIHVWVVNDGPHGNTTKWYLRNLQFARVGSNSVVTLDGVAGRDDVFRTLLKSTPTVDQHTQFAYNKDGRVVAELAANNQLTRKEYDATGNLVRVTRFATPVAPNTTLTASTTVTSVANQDQVTRFVYDSLNRLVYTLDGLNYVTVTNYDNAGHAIAQTRFNAVYGNATDLPTKATMDSWALANPVGRTTRTAYDNAGRVKYSIDAGNYVTETTYVSGSNLVESATRYANATQASTYTSAAISADLAVVGRKDSTRDQTTRFQYDGVGRLWIKFDALQGTETYTYTKLGLKKTYANALNSIWTYEYDAAGRLIKETTPKVDISWYDASMTRRMVSQRGLVTTYRYDGVGNIRYRDESIDTSAGTTADDGVTLLSSQSRSTQYLYDALNHQVQVIAPQALVNGNSDAITNDSKFQNATLDRSTNATTGVNWDSVITPTSIVTYDSFGRAVMQKDAGNNYSYKVYDALDRVRYEIDALKQVTEYNYDAFGNTINLTRYGTPISSMTDGVVQTESGISALLNGVVDKRVINTDYDQNNRAIAVREGTGNAYSVDGVVNPDGSAGDLTGAWGGTVNGGSASWSKKTTTDYNAYGEATKQATLIVSGTRQAATYSYFDARGKKLAQVDAEGYLTRYQYDAFGNLTSTTEYAQSLGSSWTLKSDGTPVDLATAVTEASGANRIIQSTYDLLNRKVTDTKVGVGYDAVVNNTGIKSVIKDVTSRYEYDAIGNQVSVTDANNNQTRTYYDALGHKRAELGAERSDSSVTPQLPPIDVWHMQAKAPVFSSIIQSSSCFNSITLDWTATPIQGWGDDREVMVKVSYARKVGKITGVDGNTNQPIYTFSSEITQGFYVQAFNAKAIKNGAKLSWFNNDNILSLSEISISIFADGNYHEVYRAAPNTYKKTIRFEKPVSTSGTIALSVNGSAVTDTPVDGQPFRFFMADVTGNSGTLGFMMDWQKDGGSLLKTTTSNTLDFTTVNNLPVTPTVDSASIKIQGKSRTLTTMDVDAYGNVVKNTTYAKNAASYLNGISNYAVNGTALSGLSDSNLDRTTLTRYDLSGHALTVVDAEGNVNQKAYDWAGHLTKEWIANQTAEGKISNVVRETSFDVLGHQIATFTRDTTPAQASLMNAPAITSATFNYQAKLTTQQTGTGTGGVPIYSVQAAAVLSYDSLSSWGFDSLTAEISYTLNGVSSMQTVTIDPYVEGPTRTVNIGGLVGTSSSITITQVVIKGKGEFGLQTLWSNTATSVASGPNNSNTNGTVVGNTKTYLMWRRPAVDGMSTPNTFLNGSAIASTTESVGEMYRIDITGLSGTISFNSKYTLATGVTAYAAGTINTATGVVDFTENTNGQTLLTTSRVVQERLIYNAYGEITHNILLEGTAWNESTDKAKAYKIASYDELGRIWTVRDKGVQTVNYYNSMGMVLVSVGSTTKDLRTLTGQTFKDQINNLTTTAQVLSPKTVTADYQRTSTWVDCLGRVIRQQTPAFTVKTVASISAPGAVIDGAVSGTASTSGNNANFSIYWDSVKDWGGSQIRIEVDSIANQISGSPDVSHKTFTGIGTDLTRYDFTKTLSSSAVSASVGRIQVWVLVNSVWVLARDTNTKSANNILNWSRTPGSAPGWALMRYRANSNAAWSSLTVDTRPDGKLFVADITQRSTLAAGSYSYELYYYDEGVTVPADVSSVDVTLRASTSASGTFTVTAAGAARVNPVQNAASALPPSTITPVTRQSYDRWGNVSVVINPVAARTENIYNSNNQLIATIAKSMGITTATGAELVADLRSEIYYDALGRKIGTRDAESIRQARMSQSVSYSPTGTVGTSTVDGVTTTVAFVGGTYTTTVTARALQTSTQYDEVGHVIAERNAVGDLVTQVYDNLGNRTKSIAGSSSTRTAQFSYDRNGRLLKTQKPLTTESYRVDALGNRVETSQWISSDGVQRTVTRQAYDAFGRVIRTGMYDYIAYNASDITTGLRDNGTNNANVLIDNKPNTFVDLRTLIKNKTGDGTGSNPGASIYVNGSGLESTVQYDVFGNKVRETNTGGDTLSWSYSAESQLLTHIDLAGVTTSYTYNQAGGVATQVNDRLAKTGAGVSQNLLYGYDEAGHLISILDKSDLTPNAKQPLQAFMVDGLGRQVQDTFIDNTGASYRTTREYDALGRLAVVTSENGSRIEYRYDANSNRRRTLARWMDGPVLASVTVNNAGVLVTESITVGLYKSKEYWYDYDNANRITVSQGVLNNQKIEASGASPTKQWVYAGSSCAGSYYLQTTLTDPNSQGVEINYNSFGERTQAMSVLNSNGFAQYERYNYDDDGRLQEIKRWDDNDINRQNNGDFTAALRMLSSRSYDGANRVAIQKNWDITTVTANAKETRYNYYDGLGHMVLQRLTRFDSNNAEVVSGATAWSLDAAGNTRTQTSYHLRVDNNDHTYTLTNTYDYTPMDTQKEERTVSRSNYYTNSETQQSYDANGNVKQIIFTADSTRNRKFITNLSGQIVSKDNLQSGSNLKTQRYLVADGGVRLSYGKLDTVDADQNYTPISDSTLGNSPSRYVVNTGDTLKSIAMSVWGDASLWYVIAEANGISSDSQLQVGQSINLPSRVNQSQNNSNTIKPYNPSAIIGDTTPSMVPPVKKCGILGKVIEVVIMAVASYLGGPWGAMAANALIQEYKISQGYQSKFSWESVAMAGITTYIGGQISGASGYSDALTNGTLKTGVDAAGKTIITDTVSNFSLAAKMGFTSEWARAAVNAGMTNMVSQTAGIVLGLQKKFDWRQVAVAGIAAGINSAVGIDPNKATSDFGRAAIGFANNMMTGAVSRGVQMAIYHQGKMDWTEIAADAFGNALGSAIGEGLKAKMTVVEEEGGYGGAADTGAGESNGTVPLTYPTDQSLVDTFPVYADAAKWVNTTMTDSNFNGYTVGEKGFFATIDQYGPILEASERGEDFGISGSKTIRNLVDYFNLPVETHMGGMVRLITPAGVQQFAEIMALRTAASGGEIPKALFFMGSNRNASLENLHSELGNYVTQEQASSLGDVISNSRRGDIIDVSPAWITAVKQSELVAYPRKSVADDIRKGINLPITPGGANPLYSGFVGIGNDMRADFETALDANAPKSIRSSANRRLAIQGALSLIGMPWGTGLRAFSGLVRQSARLITPALRSGSEALGTLGRIRFVITDIGSQGGLLRGLQRGTSGYGLKLVPKSSPEVAPKLKWGSGPNSTFGELGQPAGTLKSNGNTYGWTEQGVYWEQTPTGNVKFYLNGKTGDVRIQYHQGEAPAPGETYNPRHHDEHWHVEKKIDPAKGWSNSNTQKTRPPGYQPGTGTGLLPGEELPTSW